MAKELVLVVITDDLYVRNYVTSGALDLIKARYECKFLISKNVKRRECFSGGSDVQYYDFDTKLARRHYSLLELLTWRYRNRSKTFRFRVKRFDQALLEPWGKSNLIGKALTILRLAKAWMRRIVLGNRLIFPLWFKYVTENLPVSPDIEAAVEKLSPALVLFPSAAYNADGNDVVRVCSKRNIPTVFLVDNWDNLSSKSLLWAKPDYIGVWGEQSAGHAIRIQGFAKEQVTCLGTPRFDDYFRRRDQKLDSFFDFKYILFVGTALAFDEAGVLAELDGIVSRNRNVMPGVKIVYRPHPWRIGADTILGAGLANVIVDPQVADWYSKKEYSTGFQPSIEYYPSLLQNAEFVIGGLTSMAIESLIFRKPFLALAYDDRRFLTSPKNVFNNYTHFQGLEKVDSIHFCHNRSELEVIFLDVWSKRNLIDNEKADAQRQYYYFSDSITYAERLQNLCGKVLMSGPGTLCRSDLV